MLLTQATTSNASPLAYIIALAVVVVAAVVIFFIKSKTSPSEEDKEAAKKFLKGLADTFYSKMVEIISNASIEDFDNLPEFESNVLSQIYDTLWDYTQKQLEEASKDNIITAMVLKVINKDYVLKFIDQIISTSDINKMINDVWAKHFKDKSEELEKEEDAAYGIDENGEKVKLEGKDYNEDFDIKDLDKAEPEEPDKEELEKVIPPSEDEDGIDEENAEEVFIDAQGRKRDKKTGRYIK